MPLFPPKMAFIAPLPTQWHQDRRGQGKRLIIQLWWLIRPLVTLVLFLLCVMLALLLGGCTFLLAPTTLIPVDPMTMAIAMMQEAQAHCRPSISLRMPLTATIPNLTIPGMAGEINNVGAECNWRY